MKALGVFIVSIFLIGLSSLVTSWGYQVFWNDIVLNVWQLFSDSDVINTMRINYGACLAIAFGVSMIYPKKSDNKTVDVMEAVEIIMRKMLTNVIMILLTLLVASIVF